MKILTQYKRKFGRIAQTVPHRNKSNKFRQINLKFKGIYGKKNRKDEEGQIFMGCSSMSLRSLSDYPFTGINLLIKSIKCCNIVCIERAIVAVSNTSQHP